MKKTYLFSRVIFTFSLGGTLLFSCNKENNVPASSTSPSVVPSPTNANNKASSPQPNVAKSFLGGLGTTTTNSAKPTENTTSPSNTTSVVSNPLPSSLSPGVILRYHRSSLRDRVVGYIHKIDQASGQIVLQYMILDDDGERYFYGTRIFSLDNLKFGHRLNQWFSYNGGIVEKMLDSSSFLGSSEMLTELKSQGSTTFSTSGNRATSLHKMGEASHELFYNGQKVNVPILQTKTGPINSAFYKPFPIWFVDQASFPILVRNDQTMLGSIDDLPTVASMFQKTLESKQTLLTGSLYFAIYNLSGSATRREITQVARDIWIQGIIPVVKKQTGKKLVVEIFTVANGAPSITKGERRPLPQVITALQKFLIDQGIPAEQLVVKAATSTDNLPEEFSPIGQDPQNRILIRFE